MLHHSPDAEPPSPTSIHSGLEPASRTVRHLDFALVPARIAEALGQEIIAGRMAPGSRVVEEEIAERYGVSRSPVRESIRLLERDGLVLREERRGAWVSPLNRRNLNEVYTCRVTLECVAAAEAAAKHTPDRLRAIEDALAQMVKALGAKDVASYFAQNVAYTEAIQFAADNATLRRLLVTLSKQAQRYRYLAYRNFPHLMGYALDGSQDLLNAITRRDGPDARVHTERLIRRAWQTISDCVPD